MRNHPRMAIAFALCFAAVLSAASYPAAAQPLPAALGAALLVDEEAEGAAPTADPAPRFQNGLVFPPDWREKGEWDPIVPRRGLPARFDWRDYGGVTAIRTQGCGDCWAFAAIGALEAVIKIDYGLVTNLSEQWLKDCTDSGDCSGGNFYDAFQYMKCCGLEDTCGDSGAVLEADAPYRSYDWTCGCPFANGHPYCVRSVAYIGDGGGVPVVDAIKQAIYDYGPVAAGMYANAALENYPAGCPDGVFGGTKCTTLTPNHGVVLVGWDDNMGTSGVWIMKNSWGIGWGYSGYGYIEYGCSNIGFAACYCRLDPTYDCNTNSIPDGEEICSLTTPDCNGNRIPDACELVGNDCNTNGVPDECDVTQGTSSDCNSNGVPDECDIAGGTSVDCNTNGVPDDCDIALGASADCNSNGVPDECDVSAGTSPDCNTNGVPDECDLLAGVQAGSGPLTPLGVGYPQDFVMNAPRLATGPVTLAFQAYGDLNFSSENVKIYLNGGQVDTVLEDGEDCPATPDVDQSILTMEQWNVAAGTGTVTIRMEAASGVDPFHCSSDSWISVVVSYSAAAASEDCNGNDVPDECDIAGETSADCQPNGIPDECDIAGGTSQDANSNGVPDECEGAQWCLGDMNCSGGSPTFDDIKYFSAAVGSESGWWAYYRDKNGGANPPCPWLLGDYSTPRDGVEFSDIKPFAGSLGGACQVYVP